MALYETKTVRVDNDPNRIDFATKNEARFMWEVKSQQVTEYSDTNTRTTGSDDYYTYYETTTKSANYCTITFQRDQLMPHHDEMAEYEKELPVLMRSEPVHPSNPSSASSFLGLFFGQGIKAYASVAFVIAGIYGLSMSVAIGIVFILLGGALLYIVCKQTMKKITENKEARANYPKNLQEYETAHAKWAQEVADLNKAIDDLHSNILKELRQA